MDFETLGFDIDAGVARITLRRPDHANALDPTMSRELLRAAIACDLEDSVKAVLLDAEGRMFCAGGDLGTFHGAGDALGSVLKEMTVDLHAAISRFARQGAPVVAAVQGAAAGAGLSLACACDFVVAARSAKFTMAYTKAGLVPDGSSTYFLPRIVGRRRALEMMLLNPVLSAEVANEWGIVTRVVDDETLGEEAMALARQLASGPAGAHASAKRLVFSSGQESLESQMELEADAITEAATGADGREGIAAFLEKRTPEFGRG